MRASVSSADACSVGVPEPPRFASSVTCSAVVPETEPENAVGPATNAPSQYPLRFVPS